MLIGPVSVTLVMLHMDHIVIGLRKTAGDGLDDAEGAVHPIRPEEGVVNKVVGNAVDVGVNHQGVDKAHG